MKDLVFLCKIKNAWAERILHNVANVVAVASFFILVFCYNIVHLGRELQRFCVVNKKLILSVFCKRLIY